MRIGNWTIRSHRVAQPSLGVSEYAVYGLIEVDGVNASGVEQLGLVYRVGGGGHARKRPWFNTRTRRAYRHKWHAMLALADAWLNSREPRSPASST